jgi:hypothetical protein
MSVLFSSTPIPKPQGVPMALKKRKRTGSSALNIPFNCPSCTSSFQMTMKKSDEHNSLHVEFESTPDTDSALRELVMESMREKLETQANARSAIELAYKHLAAELCTQLDNEHFIAYDLLRPVFAYLANQMREINNEMTSDDGTLTERGSELIQKHTATQKELMRIMEKSALGSPDWDFMVQKNDENAQGPLLNFNVFDLTLERADGSIFCHCTDGMMEALISVQLDYDRLFSVWMTAHKNIERKVDAWLEYDVIAVANAIDLIMQNLKSHDVLPYWYCPNFYQMAKHEVLLRTIFHADGSRTEFKSTSETDSELVHIHKRTFNSAGEKIKIEVWTGGKPDKVYSPTEWMLTELCAIREDLNQAVFHCFYDFQEVPKNFIPHHPNVKLIHYDGTYTHYYAGICHVNLYKDYCKRTGKSIDPNIDGPITCMWRVHKDPNSDMIIEGSETVIAMLDNQQLDLLEGK